MNRGGGGIKNFFFLKRGKKSSSRPFLAHPAGGQETIFYLRMASCEPVSGGNCQLQGRLLVDLRGQ